MQKCVFGALLNQLSAATHNRHTVMHVSDSTPETTVRKATEEDRLAIDAIADREWGETESSEVFYKKTENGALYVAIRDDIIVGYAAAFMWRGDLPLLEETRPREQGETWWHLHDVTVPEEHRGAGIGTRLIQELIQEGLNRGTGVIRAVVVNTTTRRILERNDFTTEDTRVPSGYKPGVIMRKNIKNFKEETRHQSEKR